MGGNHFDSRFAEKCPSVHLLAIPEAAPKPRSPAANYIINLLFKIYNQGE